MHYVPDFVFKVVIVFVIRFYGLTDVLSKHIKQPAVE